MSTVHGRWMAVALAAAGAPALAAAQEPASPNGAALDAAAEQVQRAGAALGAAQPAPPPQAPPPAAPMTQAATAPPPARFPAPGLFLGLDFDTLGFFGRIDRVSPIPELALGYGDDAFRVALLLSAFVGDQVGYSGGLRIAGGSRPTPIGFDVVLDLQGIGVDAPTTGYPATDGKIQTGLIGELGATLDVLDLTYRAGPVLLELRLISLGYFYAPNLNLQWFAIGGGLAASWFP